VGVLVADGLNLGSSGETTLMGLAMIPAAAAIWWVAKRRGGQTRELVDPTTGERVLLTKGDSLFFIPLGWWAPILVGVGLLVVIAEITRP
jgi:hypothetical protein